MRGHLSDARSTDKDKQLSTTTMNFKTLSFLAFVLATSVYVVRAEEKTGDDNTEEYVAHGDDANWDDANWDDGHWDHDEDSKSQDEHDDGN